MNPPLPGAALAHLQKGCSLGLVAEADLYFFAISSLMISDRWHEHPAARRCIERAGREGLPLNTLMDDLSDDERLEIKYHGAGRC